MIKPFVPVKAVVLIFYLVSVNTVTLGQRQPSEWQSYELPFRALNIASRGNLIWVCGSEEGIAVSSDNGANWKVKHQTAGGGLLLNIDFTGSDFGYAAGTGGLFLTTVDGGETWVSHPGISDTILQLSFSDTQHGLIRTHASLESTVDGGLRWSAISVDRNPDVIKEFPYTFSLVALDSSHMAVLLKHGPAQYESAAVLYTQDSGKSWYVANIPNVTIYSFLRIQGRYWAVGTEVIHKDQPGGGYGVPAALYSSDGENWSHSASDLSSCKLQTCSVCNTGGCLSSNGVLSRIFVEKTIYGEFPANADLTPKWASSDSSLCFVGRDVQCAALREVQEAPNVAGTPAPTALAPAPLGAPVTSGPQCIFCELERVLIDQKAHGVYTIKLILVIGRDGIVTSVEAQGAPTVDVKFRIEQQARQWVFEPYLKDGAPVNVRLNTGVKVNVIKSP